jgi:hypothetical protein
VYQYKHSYITAPIHMMFTLSLNNVIATHTIRTHVNLNWGSHLSTLTNPRIDESNCKERSQLDSHTHPLHIYTKTRYCKPLYDSHVECITYLWISADSGSTQAQPYPDLLDRRRTTATHRSHPHPISSINPLKRYEYPVWVVLPAGIVVMNIRKTTHTDCACGVRDGGSTMA